jgi:hypothetical protein
MRLLLFIIFALGLSTLSAQILENNTDILNAERGTASFKLNAGQSLYSYEPSAEGWYKVRKVVYLKMGSNAEKTILAGTKLYNKSDEQIGEVLEEIKAKELDTIEGFRSGDRIIAVLEGFIFKTKIEDNSIPEQRVESILQNRNRDEQQKQFATLKNDYEVEKRKFDEFTALVLREENKTLAAEKDFRIIVVFRDGTSTYAVITNGHNIAVPKVKDTWDDGNLKITYLYKPSTSQREEIDSILFTFLAL